VCGWAEDELCTICDAFIDELADSISVFTALTAATEDPARFTQGFNLALREASARMRAESQTQRDEPLIQVVGTPRGVGRDIEKVQTMFTAMSRSGTEFAAHIALVNRVLADSAAASGINFVGAYYLGLATLAFEQGYEVSEEQMRELVAVRSKEQAITLARRWWPGEWLDRAEALPELGI
jgi:hypothetical protein